jgi:hypothetical protein
MSRNRGTRARGAVPYVPDAVPEAALDPLLTDYLRRELDKIRDALIGDQGFVPGIREFASDAAAASGGVPIKGLYHTAGAVKVRRT